jgi:hypothetical protein
LRPGLSLYIFTRGVSSFPRDAVDLYGRMGQFIAWVCTAQIGADFHEQFWKKHREFETEMLRLGIRE